MRKIEGGEEIVDSVDPYTYSRYPRYGHSRPLHRNLSINPGLMLVSVLIERRSLNRCYKMLLSRKNSSVLLLFL